MPINDQTSKPMGAEVRKDLQPRETPTGAEIRKQGAPTNTSPSGRQKMKKKNKPNQIQTSQYKSKPLLTIKYDF